MISLGTCIFPIPQDIQLSDEFLEITQDLSWKIRSYIFRGDIPKGIEGSVELSIPSQGYRIIIRSSGIILKYSDDYGLLYAMITLKQLVISHQLNLPCLEIFDYPDLLVRGYLLDISRDKIPTMETLFSLVDTLSLLKYNQLQLYMELAFSYAGYEQVWEGMNLLTPDDVEKLDQYCAIRGIELVPNQSCFSHLERWLDHPSMAHLAEVSHGFKDPSGNFRNHRFSLNTTDPDSIQFIGNLMDQLLPHFKSDLVNVNCDETFDLGQGKSRQLCNEIGSQQLYINFLKKIFSQVHQRGKTAMFWGDILKKKPMMIPDLPPGVIALDWGYEKDYDFTVETGIYREYKIPFYVCPGTSSWVSLTGRWDNAKLNIESAAKGALINKADGLLLTDWGDFGHHQQLILSAPGICYAAALSWCYGKNLDAELSLPVARWFLGTENQIWGKYIIEMGFLNSALEMEFRDGSVTGALLFNQMTNRMIKRLDAFSRPGLLEGLEKAEALYELVARENAENDKTRIIQREILFSISLFVHSCHLALHLESAGTIEVWDLENDIRESLSQEMEELFVEYQALWLLKNRPEGLKNSLNRLMFLKGLYDHRNKRIPPELYYCENQGAKIN